MLSLALTYSQTVLNDIDIAAFQLMIPCNLILFEGIIRNEKIIDNKAPQLLDECELSSLHLVCDSKKRCQQEKGV